jgi:Raf kinase inhibitor-like YbhB/YbcL family protein
MRIQRLGLGGLALSLGLAVWGCSSDDSTNSTGTAGTSSSSGGSSGATGSGGSQGTSGSQGTGGQGTGGSSNGGSGGSSAGSSGAGGSSVTDGGGNTDAPSGGDASGAVDGGPFTLTSSAYTEGMTIPAVHTCAGANTSPPLAWTPGPAGTKSYTLIFTDKTNMLVHWALWDIPVATTSLPAALAAGMPAGSHGASIGNNGGAYAGPCPSGQLHTYQFDLYAVDVATLPINANSQQPAVVTSVMGHKLAVASLSGTSNAKRP